MLWMKISRVYFHPLHQMCFFSFIRFVGFEGIAIILLMKLYLHQYSMTGLLIDVGGYPDSPEEGQKLDP